MDVRTFRPAVSLLLRKNIGRSTAGGDVAASERFTGAARTLDLTRYLGEGASVTTSKNCRGGSGMFSLTLLDRAEPVQQESLYGLIEPQDIIEISFARELGRYPDHKPPLYMRGIVSDVRRGRVVTESGPQRTVTIAGHDYGKMLELLRIFYQLPGNALGLKLLTTFKLYLNYSGEASADQEPAAFVKDVVEKIVGKFLDEMAAAGGGEASPIQRLLTDITVQGGVVSPFGTQGWQGGTVYDMLRYFGDVGPWNELYVEDRKDAPYLVYRPVPAKDIKGAYIQPGAKADTIAISAAVVVSDNVGRSDANVANYFWVAAPRYDLIDNSVLQAGLAGGPLKPHPFLGDYPNSSPKFYGTRPMIVETQHGARIDGKPEAAVDNGRVEGLAMSDEKRRILIESNRDNVVYEAGEMQLQGDEQYNPGRYIEVTYGGEGGPKAEYYAYQVTQEFVPMRSWTTKVQVDRGTGFINRIQRGGGQASPYFSEINMRGGR